MAMRTPLSTLAPARPTVPLLDASYLPAEDDWELLEALNANGNRFDVDEDHLAGLGFAAGDFD
jgi:hypothetical protein